MYSLLGQIITQLSSSTSRSSFISIGYAAVVSQNSLPTFLCIKSSQWDILLLSFSSNLTRQVSQVAKVPCWNVAPHVVHSLVRTDVRGLLIVIERILTFEERTIIENCKLGGNGKRKSKAWRQYFYLICYFSIY